MGFLGGSDGKESACNAGDLEEGRSPGGGHGNPLQYCCLENPQGQRGLAGHSPWDRKESDMTDLLSAHTHKHRTLITIFNISTDDGTKKHFFLIFCIPGIRCTGSLTYINSFSSLMHERQASVRMREQSSRVTCQHHTAESGMNLALQSTLLTSMQCPAQVMPEE